MRIGPKLLSTAWERKEVKRKEKKQKGVREKKRRERGVCVGGGNVKEPRNNFGQIRLIYAGLCNFMENVL